MTRGKILNYPQVSPVQCLHDLGIEEVRSGCDLMHVFFMFDEHSDKSSPEEVLQQSQALIDPLSNPNQPRPKDEWVGGEIMRQ